jgi:hypothetical protein
MKTLPVTPVETLATQRTAAARTDNTGIVPPWMDTANRNPGIVPPWLLHPVVQPEQPVDTDVPRILGADHATGYDPQPVDIDDNTPRIWG